jgi:hypothetical protein
MRYDQNLDMDEIIHVMKSVSDYNKMCSFFNQLDPAQRETLNVYYDRMLQFSKDKKWMDQESLRAWNKINLHVVLQMWGSTACGWGGMGGAAMTNSYTTVIESIEGNAIFVYYNGKLAYVAEIDDKLKPIKEGGYENLPSISNSSKILTTYYVNKNKR